MATVLSDRVKYPQRLFLWLLGYSILLVGCFIGFQYHREKEFKAAELNAQLQMINARLLDGLTHGETVEDIPVSHPFKNLRISVIDTRGNILYDNSPDIIPHSNHLSREEIRKARATGTGYTVRRHSTSTGNTYFYSAMSGNNGLIVRTAVPYSVSLSELLRADMGFLWIMSAVTLLMCILGYFATRRIGLHIMRLNLFAEKAEKGERIYDIAPFPNDELGSISNHIVRLYANLQQAIADRNREHRAALFQQREKERIKRQLTNNINHELKTPVTSILVCLETLINHSGLSEEKRTEFLQRCLSNTERLQRLLSDVSIITRMEDAPTSIKMEEINLTDIINDVVIDSEKLAEDKGMHIFNRLSAPLYMNGNAGLMESVFRNLIDNAIAYSGGSKITISASSAGDSDNRIAVCVADDGCGVAPEHLPRLFERFYRIDTGRSRAAGGTGLGLAIVKNAVILHGGTVSVANAHQGGLIFTINLTCR